MILPPSNRFPNQLEMFRGETAFIHRFYIKIDHLLAVNLLSNLTKYRIHMKSDLQQNIQYLKQTVYLLYMNRYGSALHYQIEKVFEKLFKNKIFQRKSFSSEFGKEPVVIGEEPEQITKEPVLGW